MSGNDSVIPSTSLGAGPSPSAMSDWFSYALRLSDMVTGMKFEMYGAAVSSLVAAAEERELQALQAQLEEQQRRQQQEDQKEPKNQRDQPSNPTGHKHDDPAKETLAEHQTTVHNMFLLTKPKVGGSTRKSREACLDAIEFEMESAYLRDDMEDGFVLTAEDEQVLAREMVRQEHWFPVMNQAETTTPFPPGRQQKEGEVNTNSNGVSPLPCWPPPPPPPQANPAEEVKHETNKANHAKTIATTTGSGGMALYGELTSLGVRQMHQMHQKVLQTYYHSCSSPSRADGDHLPCEEGHSPRGSHTIPDSALLQIDIGSGTGKVVFEWSLLASENVRISDSLGERAVEGERGEGEGKESTPVVTMGIEIMPSRMAVAKKAMADWHYAELVEEKSEEEKMVENDGAEAVGPLRFTDSAVTMERLYGAPGDATSSLSSPTITTATQKKLLPKVILTEVNALHPRLLSHTMLLCRLASSGGEPPHSQAGTLPYRMLAPHLAVLCCGVGFDDVFVRRLCLRLEDLVFCRGNSSNSSSSSSSSAGNTTAPRKENGSEEPAPAKETPREEPPQSQSWWRTASMLLLLKHFDVEGELQQPDFPLFRCVQDWYRKKDKTPTTTTTTDPHAPQPEGGKAESTPISAGKMKTPHEESAARDQGTDLVLRKERSTLPSWCGGGLHSQSSNDKRASLLTVQGGECDTGGRIRLVSSCVQYTHVETTWMKETPAWHLQFMFEESI